MRIVSWNIRAGGGTRVAAIADALLEWRADVIVLSEFRGTPPSTALLHTLAESGFPHVHSTALTRLPGVNCLAIASSIPYRRYHAQRRPAEPGRWLAVELSGPAPIALGAVHIPNEVTKRKWPYMEAMAGVAHAWRRRKAVIVGDTNSGQPLLDEETPVFGPRYPAWFSRLEACGWRDSFRHLNPELREFTWYSPNGGNGFRIDQAFVSRPLLPAVASVAHAWAPSASQPGRRDAVSDHAALIIDLGV